MPNLNSIFEGVTTSPGRDVVARIIAGAKPEVVYSPCVGRYGAAQAMLAAGVPPERMWCSDVSLFSSIIGYLADPTLDLSELGIEIAEPFAELVDDGDPMTLAAVAMLALKWDQVPPTNIYNSDIRREIRKNAAEYRERIRTRLQSMVDRLGPIHYELADVREVVSRAQRESGAALYINPPGYARGYEKMYPYETVRWSKPSVMAWDPKVDRVRLFADLAEVDCLALLYSIGDESVPEGWKAVFAKQMKHERVDYVWANRDVEDRAIDGPFTRKDPRRFEIYDEQEITPETKIQFVAVDKETCLYYRDLFVHRLGSTESQSYYLMLLDGRVVTPLGLHLRDLTLGRSEYASETFGITKTSRRYKRLGKLFMMALTSVDFQEFLIGHHRWMHLRPPRGIRTTSITRHPEGKTDCGVLKVVHREKLEGGDSWRLIYQTDFREESWPECIARWLEKHGEKRRG